MNDFIQIDDNKDFEKIIAPILNQQHGVFLTNSDFLKKKWWHQLMSQQPFYFPWLHACCGLEFDCATLNKELIVNEQLSQHLVPEQSKVMIISGPIGLRQAYYLKELHKKLLEPKWVMAVGSCTSNKAPVESYGTTIKPQDLFPVDVYVPGCPPTPESIIAGLDLLEKRISTGASAYLIEKKKSTVPDVVASNELSETTKKKKARKDRNGKDK